jgi:hypothetical protein
MPIQINKDEVWSEAIAKFRRTHGDLRRELTKAESKELLCIYNRGIAQRLIDWWKQQPESRQTTRS